MRACFHGIKSLAIADMFTLLHGDNTEGSRTELILLKTRFLDREIREINGRTASLTQLIQALESSSLFGTGVLVIVERLLGSLGRKTSLIKEYAEVFSGHHGESDIILWEDKEIGAGTIKLLGPRLEIRVFKTSPIIFRFLDTIRPGGKGQSLVLLTQSLDKDVPERIYSLLVKRIRQLIMAKEGIIPEGIQSWQAGRLTSQAKLFTMEKLQDMHTKLHRYETSLKSGLSPYTMEQILKLFIADV